MTDPALSSIGIEITPAKAPLLLALAASLRQRYGSRIHLYVRSPQEESYFRSLNSDGQFSSITNCFVLSNAIQAQGLDDTRVAARARQLEEEIGETFSRLMFSHRQLGRGFAPGAFYYPRSSYFARASHTQVLHAYTVALEFWEREIRTKELSLILEASKEAACMCRRFGLKYRRLDTSRYKSYWYWSPNEYFFNPAVEAVYSRTEETPAVDFDQAYGASATKDPILFQNVRWSKLLARITKGSARYLYWKMRRYEKARSFSLWDIATFPLRERFAFERMTGKNVRRLHDLGKRPFVYFPLHKEPEVSLQLMSPEYFNQQNAILSLARDIPAGIPLVLKENLWSLGRRPANFYDQLADLKNVVFLDIRERGLDVIRRADVTATITGTAGFEAAVLGKPVITFGRHNLYSMLPHVRTIIDEAQLAESVRWALSPQFDAAAAKRDGARFLGAVLATSVDLGRFGWAGEHKSGRIDPEVVERALIGLVASMSMPDVNAVSSLKGAAAA